MRVVGTSQLLGDNEAFLSYIKPIFAGEQKEIGSIECILKFGTPVMLDYQKELFMDTLGDLVGGVQSEGMTFVKVQQLFELALQDVNVRLGAFGEKMQEKGPFFIDGILQVFREDQYIASLIGTTSVVVLRKGAVHYRVCQDRPENPPRIDRFNELLEGELKSDDQLFVVGIPLDTYMDKEDMNSVIEQAEIQERTLEETTLSLLSTRLEKEKIGFLGLRSAEQTPILAESRVGRTLLRFADRFGGKMSLMKRFQHLFVYGLLGLITLIMLTWIIESFLTSTNQSFSTVNNGQVTEITLEDIQKDLATFKRIDPSSEQKIKKYNEIVDQLELLEKNKKWALDIKKLRAILEKDYLEGFNIESILDLDQATSLLYTFSQQEKNTVGELKQLFWDNGVFAVGKEGMVINGLDDQVRGTIVSAGLQRKVNACTLNLFRNGLYCAMDDGKLFNVMKSGLQPVTNTDADGFGINISAVGTFGRNNLYTMKNPASGLSGSSTFSLIKYTNQRGNQEAFGGATRYDVQSSPEFAKAASGLTNITVDGTFLFWSPVTTSLWQLRRPGADNTMLVREVPLLGGDTLRAPGKKSKVFAFLEARFVYIWDPETQIFTVYRSTPFKNNDAFKTTYELPYFFSVKFDAGESKVLDVHVEEGESATLYIMTANEVRKLSLSDLRDRFFKQEADKEKE